MTQKSRNWTPPVIEKVAPDGKKAAPREPGAVHDWLEADEQGDS